MITVVCTGGEAPPASLSRSWLDASGRVIAADGGLALVRRWGRRADLWIGDGDSLEGPLSDWSESFVEYRLLATDKDDSDTEAAVKAALEAGASEVWLIGGAGGRMDHWWANLRLATALPQLTRWLTAHEEIWNLGPGGTIELAAGTLSVFPLGNGPWSIHSEGLRWPLDGVDFQTWHSLSNRVPSTARLSVTTGRFLVLRPFADGGDA